MEACEASGCSCGFIETCVDGQWQCSCSDCPPTRVDSGNRCKPTLPPGCEGVATIPASCFDAGLPYTDSGAFSGTECVALCGSGAEACYVMPASDGGVESLVCGMPCSAGRAFAGMQRPRRRGQVSPVARYFAQAAYLEASSVDAFRVLARELAAHGAPPTLVRSANAAARDEARHTRMTRTIARRYGPCPLPRRAAKRDTRPLEAVALENVIEGCVRETFAALVAYHQAEMAHDADVRATMASIAIDETRHAALGFRVARWADVRLSPDARERVRAARRAAVQTLRDELAREVPASLVEVAGLPDARSAACMLAVLETTLWS